MNHAVFTSHEVQRASGLSAQQLHRFDACGGLRPSVRAVPGRGNRRLYNRADLLALLVFVELRRAGLVPSEAIAAAVVAQGEAARGLKRISSRRLTFNRGTVRVDREGSRKPNGSRFTWSLPLAPLVRRVSGV